MSYTTLALLSAIFAAIANVSARTLLKQLKVRDMFGISFLSVAGLLLLGSPWFYHFQITPRSILLLAMIICLDTIGNFFYFKSFERHEASTVTPLLALSPAFAFLGSWLLLSLTEPWYMYLIAAAIIVAVIFFSIDYKRGFHVGLATFLPAVITAACFGLSALPTKLLLTDAVTNAPSLYMLRAALIGLITLVLFGTRFKSVTTQQFGYIILRSAIVSTSWILFYYALAKGDVGIVSTLGATAPVFVFIIGAVFLHEKMTFKKLLAAGLIVLLSLTL
ncbi:MAG: DMT family transporter [Candidatus Kerfeldbacteria bacterium]|nr:DMT family transporter [Candidatus Kerfeldbacteria bacterium]